MTAMTLKQDTGLTVSQDWNTMKDQATMLVKSGFLPPAINTAEKVIAIALKGRELGVPMMEAISGIAVIQAKPAVSPQLMLALVRRTRELESFAVHAPGKPGTPPDETGAECHVKRKGQPEHVTVFGPKEAKALQLIDKDNYKKQAGTMYQWRAVAANLRITFTDVISGLYTPEEMGAEVEVKEDGGLELKDQPAVPMPKEKEPVQEAVIAPEPPRRISDAQRKKFFAMADEAGLSDDDKKKFVKAITGSESTKDLTQEQFQNLITALENALTPPESSNAANV